MKRKSLLFLLLMALFAPLTMFGQHELTVYEEETGTNSNVPIYGLWLDEEPMQCEFIIPAEDLVQMNTGTISKMTFYLSSPAAAAWNASFDVFIKEVDQTVLTGFLGQDDATVVYQGILNGNAATMDVEFSADYTYGGGNLLIGFYLTSTGTYKSATFYGKSMEENTAWTCYKNNASSGGVGQKFIPRITFTYSGGGPSCDRPESIEASAVSAHGATLTWAGGSGNYDVDFMKSGDSEWTPVLSNSTALTTNLTNLEENTTYQARVRSVCSGLYSGYKTTSFTTPYACPAPTGLVCTGVTSNSATLSWVENGEANSWQICVDDDEENLYTANTTSFTIPGLESETSYTVKVRAYCNSDEQSIWSSSISVYTGYCLPNPTSRDGKGITSVVFGTGSVLVNNVDETNGLPATAPFYGDYTDMVGALHAGVESPITITYATGTSTVYSYGTIIWVDWNNSMTFDDDEIIYMGTSAQATGGVPQVLEAMVTIPTTQALGDYRMRIAGADSYFDSYIGGTATGNHSSCFTSSYAVCHDYTLRVLEAPSCFTPTGLEVNYTGGTTAEASWTSTSTTFNISVNGTVTNNVSNPHTITGLEYGTTYEVMVQTKCGANDVSDWTSPVTFTTEMCPTENQCQLTFVLTDSWGDSWNGNAIQVVDVETGIVLGELANENLNGTQGSGENEVNTKYLSVCDGREIQFVWVTGSYPGETSYEVYDVNMELIFSGAGAMNAPVNYTVDCAPITCPKPTGLTVDDVQPRQATLSWTNGGEENGWRIAYSTDRNFDPNEAELFVDAKANPATIEVEPDQTYFAYVRANCGEGDVSKWSNMATFTSLEACPKPTELIASNVMPTSAVVSWNSNNDVELEWGVVPSRRSSWLQYDNGELATTIGSSTAGTWTWGVMYPASILNGNDVLNAINIYETSSNSADITIEVYQGGDDEPGTLLYSETVSPNGNGFHEIYFAAPVNLDPSQNLWITLTEYGTYVMASCSTDEPNNQWVESGGWYNIGDLAESLAGYGWMIRALVDVNLDPTTVDWASEGTVTSPFQLTDLTPETTYAVRVRSNCGSDGYSNWATILFTTPGACDNPQNLEVEALATTAELTWEGYQEMFNVQYRTAEFFDTNTPTTFAESFEDGLDNWTVYTLGDTPSGYEEGWFTYEVLSSSSGNNIYPHSGDLMVSSWSWMSTEIQADNWLVSPQLNLGGFLGFWVITNKGYPDSYEVLLSTGGNTTDDFTVTLQGMAPAPATGQWEFFLIDLSAYAGQQGYIAFHHEDYDANYLFIDDVCLYSQSPVIPAGEWIEIQTSEPSALLEDLEPETTYEVQVQGVCSKTETTDWTDIVTFTTLSSCEPISDFEVTEVTNNSATITWTGYQESYNVHYRTPAVEVASFFENFENGLPSDWTTVDSDGDGYTWEYNSQFSSYSGDGIVTSASYINNVGALNPDNWLITPLVDLEGAVKVWMRGQNDGSYYSEHFAICVSTTTNDIESFTTLLEGETTDEYQQFVADLTGYTGQGYIAIRHFDCTDMYYLNVDDFGIYPGEVIPAGEWVELQTTETTAVLEGLDPETTYEVQVQGNCTNGNSTEWTDLVQFTTEPSCMAPSDVTFSNVTYNSAVVSWVENNDATAWQIEVINYSLTNNMDPGDGDIINVTTNPYTLQDLEASSIYVVYVYSVCGPNDISAASDMNYFQTEVSPCAAPTDVTVDEESITSSSAAVTWTAGGSETTWQLVYGSAYDLLYSYDGSIYFDEAAINALTPVTVNTNSYTITGLDPEGWYLVFVRSMCDDGTYSSWLDAYADFETPEASGEEEEMTVTLISGWDWFSSYVEYPEDALTQFEDQIAANSTTGFIKPQSGGFVQLDGSSWSGSMEPMDNAKMYLIQTDGIDLTLTAPLANPEDHPITVGSGWNWIGYISPEIMTVTQALASLNPVEGDMMKGQNGFTTFEGGAWSTPLELEPGRGYLYLNNGDEFTFVYPEASTKGYVGTVPAQTHWNNNPYEFPTNLTMMVTLDADQFGMSEGSHEIAAFVNGECRGTALLRQALGNYVAFLTVTGAQGEEVSFRLFDVNGNIEYAGIADEQISYQANDIYGSAKNPMVLHFRNTGVNEYGQVSLFPNPTNGKVMIQGQEIEMVNVYNALGQLLFTEEAVNAEQVEIDLSSFSAGVYTVNVRMTNGQQTNQMVVRE